MGIFRSDDDANQPEGSGSGPAGGGGGGGPRNLPLLPLRDVVVYPHMVLPLFVGREKSIEALEDAMASDKQVLLVAQRNAADDNPAAGAD